MSNARHRTSLKGIKISESLLLAWSGLLLQQTREEKENAKNKRLVFCFK